MRFLSTPIAGLWLIELEPVTDDRGSFTRTFCEREFAAHDMNTRWPQTNLSHNARRGTLRGLHWQAEPAPEIKLIRCSAGAALDVIVDLRADSPTFGRWHAVELAAAANLQLYVPAGCAHGFQTLADDTELVYCMSDSYRSELARGVRFDDPELAIPWPVPDAIVSARDRALPLLRDVFPATDDARRPDRPVDR